MKTQRAPDPPSEAELLNVPPPPTPVTGLADLLDLLDLERIEDRIFRGRNRPLASPRVYGGQVLAQALVAAGRTVPEDRPAHSMHAYFILPGDVQAPIVYEVEPLRDGGSFTTRRVTAIQHGRPIFNASLSFHGDETGPDHQTAMPEGLPAPLTLPSEAELAGRIAGQIPEPLRTVLTRDRPIDFRPIDPVDPLRPPVREGGTQMWLRAVDRLPDHRLIHQAFFAYASDWGLLGTGLLPHGKSVFDRGFQVASLDHALWFHRPFRADAWLLYAMESPTAAGARAFTRGAAYDEAGRLVASTAQEGLVRPVSPKG